MTNRPVNFSDPTGHRLDDGCSTAGCSLSQYQKDQDAQKLALLEKESHKQKCEAGNNNYCSSFDRRPKPVSGIHVGYSGQAGAGIEGGAYDQWDILVDWDMGKLYVVQTIGTFGYLGTPTGLEGDVYIGTSNIHGIPRNVHDITGFLEGPQTDASIALGVDAGLFAGGEKGVSVDLDSSGKPVYTPGAGLMYTSESSLVFGGNAAPNLVDISIQGGRSESFVMKVISLWWADEE